jgi:hypothetical protein
MGKHPTPQPILDIWKTCNILRKKFFSWLLLHGKLNTKDMMTKKNFCVEFSNCILCDECPMESSMHLFFECSFSQGFWWAPGLKWNADLDINTMVGGQEQIPIGLSDGDHQHKMLEYMG